MPIPFNLRSPLEGLISPSGIAGSILGHLLHQVAVDAVHLWFEEAVRFVARIDMTTVRDLWRAVAATTQPALTGSAWHAEFVTMSVIGAAAMLPLLCVAALQAVVRQDPGGLVRTALIRVPLALLLTAVAVELVSLGLHATDEACNALIHGAGRPLHGLFVRITAFLGGPSPANLAMNFMCLVLFGLLSFLVWIELAVRSAAVAVATLFLPLALAGAALPATAPWARRLGETLTALVLSKLAIVAVLTLAVGTLFDLSGGLSSLIEGVTLFGLAAVAPFALIKLLPMVEAGATAHLEGLGRHALRSAVNTAGGPNAWMSGAGQGAQAADRFAGMASATGASAGSGTGAASTAGTGFGGTGLRPPSAEAPVTPNAPPPASPPAPPLDPDKPAGDSRE
ncbi:MAG: hypothetical protein ACYDGN_09055 [Acidimicrobiales bacterium]